MFHETQPIVASCSADKTVCLANYHTGKILGRTNQHGDCVEEVIFLKNFDLFITGSIDSTVRVYDRNKLTLKESYTLDSSITKIKVVDEKHLLIVSTINGNVSVYDYRNKELLLNFVTPCCIHDFDLNQQK